MTNETENNEAKIKSEESDRNGLINFLYKLAPSVATASIVGSIAWVISGQMQTNVTLAVMNANIITLNEKLSASTLDRYTGTQAASDKSYYISELSHLKSDVTRLEAMISTNSSRILDLERKLPK